MAVNGQEIAERKAEYLRLATAQPNVTVSGGFQSNNQRSLPGSTNAGTPRDFGSPRGSSPSTASLSSDEGMNMRFAELTHMHLKNSLHQINGQHHGLDLDVADRYVSRPISSIANDGAPLSARGGCYSARGTGIGTTKFQSLLTVKDALLEEKESAIVKLRLEVSSLQHQLKETNVTLRQLLLNKNSECSTSSHSQPGSALQSLNINGMESRSKLVHCIADREKNIDQLRSVLGKTECQLADFEKEAAREKRTLEGKVNELELCLRQKDKSIAECKKKNKSLLEKVEKYKRRVESLERYLGDLPTLEESRSLKQTMDNILLDRQNLAADLERITQKYADISLVLEEKDTFLSAESENNAQLKAEIDKLSKKVGDLERLQEDLEPTERIELQEKTQELLRLQRENEDAAKLLTVADKRIDTLSKQHSRDITKLEERIEQEENASETLKNELNNKQQASSKLQAALTKLASQNQQLMKEKMTLLEQLRRLEQERSMSKDTSRVISKLYNETQVAVRDLEAVAHVFLQTAKGDDPNLSALLGVRQSSIGINDVDDDDLTEQSVEVVNHRLADLRKLRCDIDELRSTLSNKYAESIGQNCATQ